MAAPDQQSDRFGHHVRNRSVRPWTGRHQVHHRSVLSVPGPCRLKRGMPSRLHAWLRVREGPSPNGTPGRCLVSRSITAWPSVYDGPLHGLAERLPTSAFGVSRSAKEALGLVGAASFHERNCQGARGIGWEARDFHRAARTGRRLAKPRPRVKLAIGHITTSYRGAPVRYPARFPAGPGTAPDPRPGGGRRRRSGSTTRPQKKRSPPYSAPQPAHSGKPARIATPPAA